MVRRLNGNVSNCLFQGIYLMQLLWKRVQQFLNKIQQTHCKVQKSHFWVFIPKNLKQSSKRYLHIHVHGSIIHNSHTVEAKQPIMEG